MESSEMDKKPIDEGVPQQPDRLREISDTMPAAASAIRFSQQKEQKTPEKLPQRDELMRKIRERSQANRESNIPGSKLPPFVNKSPDEPKEERPSLLSRFLKLLRGK